MNLRHHGIRIVTIDVDDVHLLFTLAPDGDQTVVMEIEGHRGGMPIIALVGTYDSRSAAYHAIHEEAQRALQLAQE